MAKTAAKKVKDAAPAPTQIDWPESIDLGERIPQGHERAGERRYAQIHNGAGRMDMMRYREVPRHLVDAALAAEAKAAEASQQAEAA